MSDTVKNFRSAEELRKTLSLTDGLYFDAVHAMLTLYDLVDLDRDLIREEMELVQGRWIDVVGEDLGQVDHANEVEDCLAEAFGID